MKKTIYLMLAFLFCMQSIHPEGSKKNKQDNTRMVARASAEGAFDAVSFSMMSWGVGMVVAIGVLTAFFDQDTSSAH